MKVKVRQVGNSLTVTIPKEIAMDLSLGPNVEMDVSVREGAIALEPVGSRWDRLVAELRRVAAEQGLAERDIQLALDKIRGVET